MTTEEKMQLDVPNPTVCPLSMSVEPSIIMAWAGKSGEKIVSDLPP